ncbi:hypothetical protein [Thermofilum sp.]|jgi:hypothetical protein|uniref:hypothetical protein n=1 Tax=Thermofilum sp. TaxID=1961369 RepID=UPI0025890F4D|nr:hypothetical protein [Thermofilum sp.]
MREAFALLTVSLELLALLSLFSSSILATVLVATIIIPLGLVGIAQERYNLLKRSAWLLLALLLGFAIVDSLPFVSTNIGSPAGLPVSLVFSVMAIISSGITIFVGSLEQETLERGYDPEEVAGALRAAFLSIIIVFLVSLFLGWAVYKTFRIIEMPGLSLLAAIIFFSLVYIMAAVVVLASTWQTESNLNKY